MEQIENIVEVSSYNCATIRQIFRMIAKAKITECKIIFKKKINNSINKGGIHICELSPSKSILVKVVLDADNFESFVCDIEEIAIMVSTKKMINKMSLSLVFQFSTKLKHLIYIFNIKYDSKIKYP